MEVLEYRVCELVLHAHQVFQKFLPKIDLLLLPDPVGAHIAD